MDTLPPLAYFEATQAALGHRFDLERLVAANRERVLFTAVDKILRRRVSLRANFYSEEAVRAWFLREAEALAQLDHPAVRHVYDTGVIGQMAYRVGNWVEGENLAEAMSRGPRPLPAVMGLARDLLGGLEHSHSQGIVVRRIVPASLLVNLSGRGTITELRFSSYTLSTVPPTEVPTGLQFMAPEIRDGGAGDPASDIYTAGALLYFALTGQEPSLDSAAIRPPSELRTNCPQAVERILMRALQGDADERYLSAQEMLEDLASEAGTFDSPAVQVGHRISAPTTTDEGRHWEKRLRRALGDDYELLEPLGTGGYGRVYRVRDLHLEREVALKVLHPTLTADPAVLERFRREAQLAARLTHPNIVSIHDIDGRLGLLWYTMELIRGRSVAQLVEKEGALPLPRAIEILDDALSALEYAHEHRLVHRDIKPENLLVDLEGRVHITDFGLAMALPRGRLFGGATSRSGTPQFAAPEQLAGGQVDARTDLFSLGAVGFYLLLGRPPFPERGPELAWKGDVTFTRPDLRPERPDVPEAFVEVLEKACAFDPDDRFPGTTAFREAIEAAGFVTGERPLPPAAWWQKLLGFE